MSEVTNASKSEPVTSWKQISDKSSKNLEKKLSLFFTFQLFSGNPNAANLAADGLNLNSWLSAFYPVPNLRLQIQQETFFEK